jgi:16S rRNA G966 N2-methylase RsmD
MTKAAAPPQDLYGQRYEVVPIASLVELPGNPRRGDVDALDESLREVGWYGAVIVRAEDNVVLAGNHRLAALRATGATEVPAILVDRDAATGKKIALVDNRANDRATYDVAALLDMLEDVGDLGGTGYSDDDVADLLAQLEATQLDAPDVGDDMDDYGGTAAGNGALVARFGAPPYSVLDSRKGYWQQRKNLWLGLGIRSEVGRDDDLVYDGGSGEVGERMRAIGGTSVFDPMLCELVYRWWLPHLDGAQVLDPFAGGSVRGVVAGWLGAEYHGLELRPEQVAANVEQADELWAAPADAALGAPAGPRPVYYNGDSEVLLGAAALPEQVDLVFTCPPYADLEVYSDDPADLSNMDYAAFAAKLATILAAAVQRLAPNRFAVVVMGEARDGHGAYYGVVPTTIDAMRAAGLAYHGEAILITPGGTLPVRAGRAFNAGRKLGKSHQNVLVFYKGDPRQVGQHYAPLMSDADLEALAEATGLAPETSAE